MYDLKGRLGEDLARNFFRQVVETILACHARGVIHRDIKVRMDVRYLCYYKSLLFISV